MPDRNPPAKAAGRINKKRTKNASLLQQIEKEFKSKRKEMELMDNKACLEFFLSLCLGLVVERNRVSIESINFSDFLKNEPHIDHWFYKLAFGYGRQRANLKKNIFKKHKFGIFNILSVPKNRNYLKPPKPL